MSSIVTITFNPTLDKSVAVEEMIPEKKLICSRPVYEPGGGGINVARAIRKLGGNVTAVYVAGGFAGKEVARLLAEEHIESVVTDIKGITRENLVVLENKSNKQYLFDMPGPQISQPEWEDCLNHLERLTDVNYIVASGSLPDGVPKDIFGRIATIAKKKNARLIVDTSGEALAHAVKAGVYLIKPNLRELGLLVGREEISPEYPAEVAASIIANGGCEAVVVSMGPQGALLVTKDMELKISQPKVAIHSTVGAGDSLVAGIVLSLDRDMSLEDAVQFGVACGISATMNVGTELCRSEDAFELFQMIKENNLVLENSQL